MLYTSRGTVRLKSIGAKTVIFVPDNNHSVKNGGKGYAVFFNNGPDPHNRGRIVELDDDKKGVQVKLSNKLVRNALAISLLSAAVTEQTKIEVTVDIERRTVRSTVTLSDIALPAT